MNFKFDKTLDVLKRLVLPVLALMPMLLLSKTFIHVNLNRWMSLVSVLIHGIIGVIIYLLITYNNKALTDVLGEEFVNKILKKLKLVK